MTAVAQIIDSKPDKNVYRIAPAASVFDAVKLMDEKSIGAVLVMEGETVVGIITERDYARKIVLMMRSSTDTLVRDVMTSQVLFVERHQTSNECMALMTGSRLRHLPVMDDGKLIGLVSIGDLVKDVISEQQFTIEQLQHYIAGNRG